MLQAPELAVFSFFIFVFQCKHRVSNMQCRNLSGNIFHMILNIDLE